MQRHFHFSSVWVPLWLMAGWSCIAADWPMYKHDAQRSSVTTEALPFPLHPLWQYRCPQPPSPAWPDPFRLLNRMDFDYAPHPVIAQGIVCFGSSSDDTIRALDAKTGQEKWHFITGGPVRFAPQIENSRIYFGSDDGFVYCLDAGSGKLVWKFQAAPADERFVGNHRMISRWPVRTGVLVADGVLYCVAGMWPAEGIFIYALQADTGKVLWCNDTVGGTPQGALLTGREVLLIPNGNGKTTPLDRRTGALMQWPSPHGRPGWVAGTYAKKDYMGGSPGRGGAWATIDGDKEYSFIMHRANELAIEPYSLTNGLTAGRAWGAGVVPQLSIAPTQSSFQIHERGKVSAIVHKGKPYARKAYGLALADNTLLLGHDGAVAAQSATNTVEIWRAPVEGEAREIAVADGRVFVATSEGVIHCFATVSEKPEAGSQESGGEKEEGRRMKDEVRRRKLEAGSLNPEAETLNRLREAGMDRGVALVLGDADGQLSLALAANTRLHVINALTDAAQAAKLRENLLATTKWHGSRIHVQHVERLDALPFAQYFANAVIVAGPTVGLAGKELYRLLRPCGGILLFAGLKPAEAGSLVKETGASEKEFRQGGGGGFVVRGKLPGALDWDSGGIKSDQRVKWPLRLLWLGGPTTRQIQNNVEGAPGPVVANGRYFALSERALTAVDAYNGAVLWSHPIPRLDNGTYDVDGLLYRVSDPTTGRTHWRQARALRANDDNVYLALEKAYFQGQGEGLIQLDARTGEQKKVYGPFNPPAPVPLKTAQSWPLQVATNQSGVVTMESTARDLVLTLTTQDPSITKLDAWELFFDFRPPETRYGLYEHGAFHIRVKPSQDEKTPSTWSLLTGPDHPQFDLSGAREAAGTKTIVTLPWAEIEKWIVMKPASFDFAATLNAHAGGRDEPIVRRHLFGNWTADGINNGWARIMLDNAAATAGGTNAPPIVAAMKDLKGPSGGGAPGVGGVDKAVQETPGTHPLTGEPVPKITGIAPVCGGAYCSANILSQSGALYDLTDNSGRRSPYSTKTGCTTPQMAALGMMMIYEEWGHCVCNHSFRASLALAPAERRLNEDWAHFYERDVDTRVRQASINLGAPGDRRDAKGDLWLKFPRTSELRTPDEFPSLHHPLPYPLGMRDAQTGLWYRRAIRESVWVPLEVETFDPPAFGYSGATDLPVGPQAGSAGKSQAAGFGPYWFNADRIQIQGTDRPWIYGSGYRGIRKATLKLNFFKPLASLPVQTAIALDGKLDEAAWGDELQSTNTAPLLPYTGTRVAFRHDNQTLYVGMQRPPMTVVTRTPTSGANAAFNYVPSPWRTATNSVPDAISNRDNWWRLIVSGDEGKRAAHFTVTPNGMRAEALNDGTRTNLDLTWNPSWQSAVQTNARGWTVEMAVPWQTLVAAGVETNQLAVNFLMNDPGLGTEALTYLGIGGCDRCSNFTPLGLGATVPIQKRSFTVRLHFAEPDDGVKAGQRVFDVILQGQAVLKDFDIVKEAGGTRKAVIKEFPHIPATDSLVIEFKPRAATPLDGTTAPILSGLELVEESFAASK